MTYSVCVYAVDLSPVRKQLKKIPGYVVVKLQSWTRDVEVFGLPTVRETPGYHDEPLRGKWKGHRSIRLTKAYRAIYRENKSKKQIEVTVLEVNKHEY